MDWFWVTALVMLVAWLSYCHGRRAGTRKWMERNRKNSAALAGTSRGIQEWLEAMKIDTTGVTRVLIDVKVNNVVRIYVERNACNVLLDLDLPEDLLLAEMVEVNQEVRDILLKQEQKKGPAPGDDPRHR